MTGAGIGRRTDRGLATEPREFGATASDIERQAHSGRFPQPCPDEIMIPIEILDRAGKDKQRSPTRGVSNLRGWSLHLGSGAGSRMRIRFERKGVPVRTRMPLVIG